MMQVVIIDDEKNARNSLKSLLDIFCPDIQILGEANGVKTGLQLISKHHPDLIFLDVEMQDGTGVDLLRQLNHKNHQVIFITAHDKYAVEAFRLSAIDYLLKPIEPNHLTDAIDKAKQRVNQKIEQSIFMENMNMLSNQDRKVVLKDSDSLYIIQIKDILRCQADGSYTRFFVNGRSPITTSINLKEYDKLFSPYGFIRSHHSHLINIQHVIRFDKADGGQIILSDGTKVPVSFRKKESLLKSLQNISENPFL
ncbi:MAG: LytTR family DNA-binding domain-containing protein [Bacteroidota bacterium]